MMKRLPPTLDDRRLAEAAVRRVAAPGFVLELGGSEELQRVAIGISARAVAAAGILNAVPVAAPGENGWTLHEVARWDRESLSAFVGRLNEDLGADTKVPGVILALDAGQTTPMAMGEAAAQGLASRRDGSPAGGARHIVAGLGAQTSASMAQAMLSGTIALRVDEGHALTPEFLHKAAIARGVGHLLCGQPQANGEAALDAFAEQAGADAFAGLYLIARGEASLAEVRTYAALRDLRNGVLPDEGPVTLAIRHATGEVLSAVADVAGGPGRAAALNNASATDLARWASEIRDKVIVAERTAALARAEQLPAVAAVLTDGTGDASNLSDEGVQMLQRYAAAHETLSGAPHPHASEALHHLEAADRVPGM